MSRSCFVVSVGSAQALRAWLLASVYNVKGKTWIAPSEPVENIQQGKVKAAAYAKEYLKNSVNLELPSLEWKRSHSI